MALAWRRNTSPEWFLVWVSGHWLLSLPCPQGCVFCLVSGVSGWNPYTSSLPLPCAAALAFCPDADFFWSPSRLILLYPCLPECSVTVSIPLYSGWGPGELPKSTCREFPWDFPLLLLQSHGLGFSEWLAGLQRKPSTCSDILRFLLKVSGSYPPVLSLGHWPRKGRREIGIV